MPTIPPEPFKPHRDLPAQEWPNDPAVLAMLYGVPVIRSPLVPPGRVYLGTLHAWPEEDGRTVVLIGAGDPIRDRPEPRP